MNFPTTQWSLLAVATLNGDSGAHTAWGDFYRSYRGPVIAFIRCRGFAAHQAEDLAQDFMVHLMNKSMLRRADAERGRFRSFLLGALTRFLDDARTRQSRLKRGAGYSHLSIDDERFRENELAASSDTAVFDYAWALELLERAKHAVETHYASDGRAGDHSVLRAYLPGEVQPPPYEDAAARLALTPAAFKTEVHRLRVRFRQQLRREIAATVSSPHEISAEIVYLGRVLQSAPELKAASAQN
jgi:DNA-directed RNA polymerase specialized sigma24 family protein